ncbi:hypothetical protein C9413_16390 [Rhizobium sp. SEMIA 4085]|uniref:Uncharacterized protein n=1 Tax=Rhizobium gallicum bv. gallicum R602sp TaxID=1041138 RepID=A0A0B4X1E5_9HYPH|nr:MULTISPECIES: hypothetical protein [Rhizobium]AJD40560.1 hypothetical protein RGR602_CH01202 [Rhizobium gallicum bv. gallicum R602sp]NNH31023.1 hypothetical protein [Rhizobium sp. SEMIA 4085]TDW27721.1 hypothetical protein EV128_11084 [Rhizobium azibense]
MASPLSVVVLAAGLAVSAPSPDEPRDLIVRVAGDCSAAAEQVVEQTGGQLLSVQPSGNTCIITVLVQGNGQRPRKVTVRVPM